jgi:HK97 gp10 family phage protein
MQSITHRLVKEKGESVAEVGTNVKYGFWLEFGTSKMYPHPFMTPAFEANKESIKEYIAKAVQKAADDAGR